jgi:hypothetical protein
LFAQLSVVKLKIESQIEIYPQDLVEIVDLQALMPAIFFVI